MLRKNLLLSSTKFVSILSSKPITTYNLIARTKYIRYLTSKATNLNNFASSDSIKAFDLNIKTAQSDISRLDTKFENSEVAFRSKTNVDLIRGLLVFQLCGLNFLVNNQHKIMKIARKLLGKRLFAAIMRATFYGHFVAGETQALIKPTIENMMKYGVKSILDYSVEDDLASEASQENIQDKNSLKKEYFHPLEYKYDKNMEVFMECIDAVSTVTNAAGLAAIKLTSLLRTQLLVKLNDYILHLKESNNQKALDLLNWDNLANEQLPLSNLFKSDKFDFTTNELGEIRNLVKRLDKLMQHATDVSVRVFIDAEQTYFQAAIRFLTIQLMRKYNKSKNIVFNTYQNYLKSANEELLEDLKISEKEDFYFGAKLVRGAYIETERPRAKEYGYEDPINPTYEATTEMYEKNLILCMQEIKKRKPAQVAIMVASHNEDTVRFAVQKMDEFGIKASDRVICFGQLYGMCDYLSFSLGAAGYSVYKYTPYGPVEEVLPYLSRRAVENRGIFDKVKKEKRLLMAELKRRLLSGQFTTST